MLCFTSGLVLFFAAHFVSIINDSWRERMVMRIGVLPWKALYSVVSLTGFVLMIWGYGNARLDSQVLYVSPVWLHYVSNLLMLFVFPLFASSFLPGRIKSTVKHPVLAGTKIWAFSHLLANGALVDVLLFGSFLVWAVAGRISMKHRAQRPVPELAPAPRNDAVAVVAGLAVYAVFALFLHRWLIGVPVTG